MKENRRFNRCLRAIYIPNTNCLAVTELSGDLVTHLRSYANLRYLYLWSRKTDPSAPKLYDGKTNWECSPQIESRFEEVGRLPDQTHVEI